MKATTRTRYLKRRLWKITTRIIQIAPGRARFAKHYEKRSAVGEPWQYVAGNSYLIKQ